MSAAQVARVTPLHVDDRLEPGAEQPGIDRGRTERAVHDLLVALGRDVSEEGLRDTPRRVAAAFDELLTHEPVSLTTLPNDAGYDELVVVKAIPFHSLCMHHVLPFHGVAHVAYLPGERIIGLPKLVRVVEVFARDLQLQERLTMQVADCLESHLRPKGVGVVLRRSTYARRCAACRRPARGRRTRRCAACCATTRARAASSSRSYRARQLLPEG